MGESPQLAPLPGSVAVTLQVERQVAEPMQVQAHGQEQAQKSVDESEGMPGLFYPQSSVEKQQHQQQQQRQQQQQQRQRPRAITYLHLYECSDFSVRGTTSAASAWDPEPVDS